MPRVLGILTNFYELAKIKIAKSSLRISIASFVLFYGIFYFT